MNDAPPLCVGCSKGGREPAEAWVSFAEAATAFGDPLSITIADPDHTVTETRFILIGRSRNDHLVVVAHMERGDTIRLISARPASRRERDRYEEGE